MNKEPSENDYLLNIITNHGSLDPIFNKEITDYRVEVENEVTNIEIKVVKEDSASIVTGEGVYALQIGENEISITVQAENGNVRTYNINVVRKQNRKCKLNNGR